MIYLHSYDRVDIVGGASTTAPLCIMRDRGVVVVQLTTTTPLLALLIEFKNKLQQMQ